MALLLRFIALCIISTLLLLSSAQETIEVESAVIQCNTDEGRSTGDDGTVNWKPKPLTSFNKTVVVGPHDPTKSDLKEDVENDLDLEVISSPLCQQELIITLKIKNEGTTESGDGALIKLDHVLDERTQRVSRLGQPLAIKVQPGPLFTLYALNYLYSVNAQAQEQIINYENTPDFVECEDLETPTCGFERDENGPIQSSRGFCCPCGKGLEDSSKRQLRGKQQCSGINANSSITNTPSTTVGTSSAHHSSAHCLRWSKYWYAVHELGPPEVFRQLYVHVYKNIEIETGEMQWVPLGSMAKIDSHNQTHFVQKYPALSVVYRKIVSLTKNTTESKLKPLDQVLLIPKQAFEESQMDSNNTSDTTTTTTPNPNKPSSGLPLPFRGTIDNTYLVVPKSLIDLSGIQCDRVGVSHDAFKGQVNPCVQSQGTCLKNQPFGLWAADSDDKPHNGSSSKTHYRLKNFGKVHVSAPLKFIRETLYLTMEHGSEEEAVSYVDIELSGDKVQLVKPGYNTQILSVTTDSSFTAGKLIVVVANNEQVPGFFAVHVLQCTEGLPIHKSDLEVIGPQRTRTYPLDMHYGGQKLSSKATCAVAVLNQYNEIVAVRRSSLAPGDTCICYVGCECGCAKGSLECIPLSEDRLRSSGFSVRDLYVSSKLTSDEGGENGVGAELYQWVAFVESHWIYVVSVWVCLLLLLGTCKGLIGRWCSNRLGRLGLGYFHSKPRNLSKYHEKQYSRLDVIHDDDGYPLDPFTKLPTVQRLSSKEELGLNSVFFLCCPLIFLLNLYKCFCSFCCRCLKRKRKNYYKPSQETEESNVDEYEAPKSRYNSTTNMGRQLGFHPKSILKPAQRGVKSMQNLRNNAARQEADYSLRPSTSSYQYRRNPFNGQHEYANVQSAPVTPRYGSWHRRPDVLSATPSREGTANPKSEIVFSGYE